MQETILISLASIGVIAIASQWLAWWVKLPAILFLLLAGIVAGPVTGWLNPEALFGDLLFPFVSLSVAIILFEGALTLRFNQIKGLGGVVQRLITVGVLVTWTVTTLITHYVVDFSWSLALLFGAITVVTGPTVIVPMLRTIRPNARIANILRWEGITIDPLGALLAVLVFEWIVASGHGSSAWAHSAQAFGKVILVGTLAGCLAGSLCGQILKRHLLPEYLHNMAVLAAVFAVFVGANHLSEESGLLAVTIMGMWLANMKGVHVEDILNFKESLSILLISALFIILAARLDFAQLQQLGWPALWVFLGIQFIARPLKVWVSTTGSDLTWQEKAMLGWIAPRGIVAAAVAALFAIRLTDLGDPQAELIVPLTFIVIIGTVVLQSATSRLFATWLGVAEPEPTGFLIVGANPLARAVAAALKAQNISSLLVDTRRAYTRTALMEGLKVYRGNPVSRHADEHLDLVGVGHLLAITGHQELNTLSAQRYGREFGLARTFSIATIEQDEDVDESREITQNVGQVAFSQTYKVLSKMLSEGAQIKATLITDEFTCEDYYQQYYKRAVQLFGVHPDGKIRVADLDGRLEVEVGWLVLSLIAEEEMAALETEAPPNH